MNDGICVWHVDLFFGYVGKALNMEGEAKSLCD
jgi:hypothetical protein